MNSLTITLPVKGDAAALAELLIELERHLRGTGHEGFIPVTPKTRLADALREARRELQASSPAA